MTKILSLFFGYSTASTDDAAYIIGGENGGDGRPGDQKTIAEFRNNQWRNLGSLTTGRRYHGSITNGRDTMIIGGYSYDAS